MTEMFGDGRTRVLLAIVGGAESVREVADAAGLKSPGSVFRHINALIVDGLVVRLSARRDGRPGPLRPAVQVVAHTPEVYR